MRLFRSDFRYVADYFVQKRLTDDYKPSVDVIRHVDATLKLMKVLTRDDRFEEVIPELRKKGGVSMCDVLDRIEDKGRTEGRIEGKREGEQKGEQKGMNRLGKLINLLLVSGRTNEAVKASTDPAYRDKLLKEFGI